MIILFGSLLFFIMLGIPISFSVGLCVMSFLLTNGGFPPPAILPTKMVEGVMSFPLLALPLFILAGELMGYGCTPRIMKWANLILGRLPGGLAVASTAGCGLFGAISGSGVATCAAVGGIMAPEMVKEGYDKGFTASIIGGAGVLGIVIPPSLSLIVYGVAAEQNIKSLFLAGLIPGFLTIFLLMALSVGLGIVRNWRSDIGSVKASDYATATISAFLPLMMPIIVLGSVLSGAVTPTESAVIAVTYAFILSCIIYRELKWPDIIKACRKTVLTSSVILFIISCSTAFGWVITVENIPQDLVKFVLSFTENTLLIYLIITALLLFLGTFMETFSIIIIMTPICLPIVKQFGIDPIHFGIVMILNIAIGGMTPPLAVNLFTLTRILKIEVEDTFPEILYVIGMMLISLLLVLFIPQISLFLPNMFN